MSLMHHMLASTDLAAAIDTVGYALDGDGRIYILRTPIRVTLVDQTGTGILTGVTRDGWLELQLDGETRRDEWQCDQVALEPPTLESVLAEHGFDVAF